MGVLNIKTTVQNIVNNNGMITFERATKFFELSNHLGNVLATLTDKKMGRDAGNGTIGYYNADVITCLLYTSRCV